MRDALPLFAAQGVTFVAGVALSLALVQILPPAELAHFGPLREGLRWAVVPGLMGLSTGLLRVAPERPQDAGNLLLTAWCGAAGLSIATVAALLLTPGLLHLVLQDPVAETAFRLFGWKVPFIALFSIAVAMAHAQGRLVRKGCLEGAERVLVLAGSVTGAVLDGFHGLVVGSLAGSATAAAVGVVVSGGLLSAPDSPQFRPSLLPPLLAVGGPRAGVQLVEALRPLALLAVMTHRGGAGAEMGLLYGAMMLTLPLVAIPERVAQAIYPTMLDRSGETPDLDARGRRISRELVLVGLPALLLAGVVLSFVLPVLKGGSYAGSVPALWALLPGVAAHGLAAHVGYVVLVRRRLVAEMGVSLAALAVTVLAAWTLVPALGALGGATALSTGLVVRLLLLALVARGTSARAS